MFRLIPHIIFFLLLGIQPALAAPTAPWTWEELKSLAGENNPALRSAKQRLDASAAGVNKSYGEFLPELTLSARRNRTETEVSILSSVSKSRVYSVGASWNLFNGFASWGGTQKAKALRGEATAARDQASADLRASLRRAFFSLYVNQEKLGLFERILKRQQQNEKLVSLKYENGTEARWNVLKTSAERERAEYSLAAARADLGNAREELARLLHVESLPERPIAPLAPPALPSPYDLSRLPEHPDFRASAFNEEQARVDRVIARSVFFPSIDLSYSRNRSQDLTGARTRTDSKAFEVSARWNIFNGLSDFFNVQQANLAAEAATLERESTVRRLETDIRVATTNLSKTQGRLPSAKSLRQAAEERVRTVSAQYRSGLKNYLEWEQAESQLIEAEQQEVAALENALTALATFERAVGITLEEP